MTDVVRRVVKLELFNNALPLRDVHVKLECGHELSFTVNLHTTQNLHSVVCPTCTNLEDEDELSFFDFAGCVFDDLDECTMCHRFKILRPYGPNYSKICEACSKKDERGTQRRMRLAMTLQGEDLK